MTRPRISRQLLTPAAQRDLDDIWDYTARTWSPQQASAYLRSLKQALQMIASQPRLAREREDISPPVRIHPFASHLIIYRIEDDHILVIRIVHSRQSWQTLLEV